MIRPLSYRSVRFQYSCVPNSHRPYSNDVAWQLQLPQLGMSLVIQPGAPGRQCTLKVFALLIAHTCFVNTGQSSLGIADDARVRFTWRSNSEPNLAGYRLYVGTVPGNYVGFVNAGRASSFELTGLVRGMTYYFALTAYDTAGLESGFSPELTRQIPMTATTVQPAQLTTLDAPAASEPPPNSPPSISTIPDQSLSKNRPSDPIPFTVSDMDSSADALQLAVSSSNPMVVPSAGLTLAGSDGNRTLMIDSANGETGVSLVTLTVTDGSSTTSMSFVVTVERGHPD